MEHHKHEPEEEGFVRLPLLQAMYEAARRKQQQDARQEVTTPPARQDQDKAA
jgi:hypothetical protein